MRIAQTSSTDTGTTISPAIRRELDDVLSMRTATSSHSSPDVEVSDDAPGVPPNHHTLRVVDDDDNDDGSLPMLLCILRNGDDDDCLYKLCENEPVAVAMLVNAATLPILPDDRRTHPLSIEFLIIVMEIRSVVRGHSGMLSMISPASSSHHYSSATLEWWCRHLLQAG